ncbi:alpha-L-fucosidase [Sphingobacterium spiritivorum]|uniref:alpha-L-fucosidase n=1 Tax=Sphingobacterium spiritivorum TaxID=258 RepID=UPI003DA51717
MKTYALFLFVLLSFSSIAQELLPATKPSKSQQLMIKRGYGMFVHFGVNTFTDMEWSDGSIPAERYNPTDLDPDQWVRVARDAGFRYVLLITKHHDGFCLWDSKYTEYDVASSPVKTDVVKAVSDACKKYGLEFAIYYSLWDRNAPVYKDKDPQKYIDYMKSQLTELFTNYGQVCELWLDGGWEREPKDWGIDQLYKLVKSFNPNCAFSVNHTIVNEEGKRKFTLPSEMTEDNKYYFQYFPSDFRLWDPQLITRYDKKQYLHNGKSYYLPFEHTICLSGRWNWFQKSKELPVRNVDELEELFYWSTYNDNSLVINVPPDLTGQIREYEANAVIELGRRLGIKKNKVLPKNGKFISALRPAFASSTLEEKGVRYEASAVTDGKLTSRWAASDTLATLEISLDPNKHFNKISIFEYQDTRVLDDGFSNIRNNRIEEYCIQIWEGGQWKTIYLGNTSLADCKVIKFPKYYQSAKIRLKILKAKGLPSINEINVIDMPGIV